MKEEFKNFLIQKVGIKPDLVNLMTSEAELPEDYDIEKVATEWETANKTVVLAKHGEGFAKGKLDNEFSVYRESQNQKLNKLFELGMTRKEVKDVDPEEMYKLVKDTVQKQIENASVNTDDELRKELSTLKTATNDWKTKFETMVTQKEAEVEKARSESANMIRQHKVDQIFNKQFSSRKWGVDPSHVPVWQDRIKTEIVNKLLVNEDGTVTSKNGDGDALNFEGNGTYKTIDEPINYLFQKYKLESISNGGVKPEDGERLSVTATPTDKMSDNTKALRERALAAANKRYKVQ